MHKLTVLLEDELPTPNDLSVSMMVAGTAVTASCCNDVSVGELLDGAAVPASCCSIQ